MSVEGRPNIIFIMLDTFRADYLKMYNGSLYLGNIEKVAKKGTIYMNAVAPGTYTATSHASIFLGKRVKSIKDLMKDKLLHHDENTDPLLTKTKYIPEGSTTLAKRMSYLGYQTALFSNNPLVTTYTGIAEGFSHIAYTDNVFVEPSKRSMDKPHVKLILGIVGNVALRNGLIDLSYLVTRPVPGRRLDKIYVNLRTKLSKRFSEESKFYDIDLGAKQTNALVDDYLKTSNGAEKFMFINYMEAHEGYPTNLLTSDYVEQDKWLYLAKIIDDSQLPVIRRACEKRLQYLDSKIGELFKTLKANGALDNAVVVLASDHGQAFMEHNQMYHIVFPYNELVHVPLVTARFVNGKQVDTKAKVEENVSLTALHDALLKIAYGQTDVVNGSLRRDKYLFSDHNGINEVWDAHLLELYKNRSSYINAVYKAKLHFNTFATAVYHGKYKMIHYAGKRLKDELYDLSADPAESENIIGSNRGIARTMLKAERAS